ncbi:putative protein kinase RLK-Pelle-CrRLK1L-1 family [Helianthus annuus]|nr:putative protein kinase RLK-Pelle-CrRLK1L-1 family [Helianthus annuus]KAJ0929457.1 putative protein kinase RLK-Pelle-CrRLK1L-1 family [Helianthus annuus]
MGSASDQGASEFWTEVNMLFKLRHCNIVSLIGYCIHEHEKILVYEFMPNGTLDDHLHKRFTPLSWLRRLNICIGAGRGLRYLHNDTGLDSGVIHSDFKSSIFYYMKLGQLKFQTLGCRKHVQQISHLLMSRHVLKALMATLILKCAVDETLDKEQWGLVPWAQDYIKEGNLKHIIDSDIRGEISPQCLKEFVKTIDRCLNNSQKHRPTMVEVVASLESALTLQENYNMQAASGTIFGRVVNMLPFPANGENSGISSSLQIFWTHSLYFCVSLFAYMEYVGKHLM